MRRIVVATDFSERSDRAVRRAIFLARQHHAAVVLAHVVDDDGPARLVDIARQAASEFLDQEAETLAAEHGLGCEAQVLLGAPFAGIAAAVERNSPDLMIIGAHRREALRDIFIGTTAERTLRSVRCPVLMVNAAPKTKYDHVLLTTDFSDESRRALSRYLALGLAPRAELSILNVFDAPEMRLAMSHVIRDEGKASYLESMRREAGRELAEFVLSLAPSSEAARMQQMVRHQEGTITNEILVTARYHSADLIVAGTRGRIAVAKLLLGSVAEGLLRDAERDVLVVPPGSGIAADTA